MKYQHSDNEECEFIPNYSIQIGSLDFRWDGKEGDEYRSVYRDMAGCTYCRDPIDHIGYADTWEEFSDMVHRYLLDMAASLANARKNNPLEVK